MACGICGRHRRLTLVPLSVAISQFVCGECYDHAWEIREALVAWRWRRFGTTEWPEVWNDEGVKRRQFEAIAGAMVMDPIAPPASPSLSAPRDPG
jgi:hypothetical protein